MRDTKTLSQNAMKTYIVSSAKARKEYIKNATSESEIRHWIINTLDLSQDWNIEVSKVPFVAF